MTMNLPKTVQARADLAIGLLLLPLTFLIFMLSPVHQLTDSNYSMLLSQSLLEHRTFTLDYYAIPRLEPVHQNKWVANGNLYQLEIVDNHLYYFFPPGTSVLSLPYVALMNAFGLSAANPDGTYNQSGEERIQQGLAALLMAALAFIFFFTARLLLSTSWSILIALSGSLGTQVWSTASRAMWADTWAILLLGAVVFMLIARETGKLGPSPLLLATLLSWTYFVRPTNAIPIICITLYLLIYDRARFISYAATGAAWLACFVFYSWYNFGQPLPNYYLASRLSFDEFDVALPGNLISPSRGLLIYVPALFFVIYLLVRYRKYLCSKQLAFLALAISAVHLIVMSGFSPWFGGGAYGARYSTGLVPWFALLGILGVRAMLAWLEQHPYTSFVNYQAPLACGGLLLLLSVFINGRGAISPATWEWNALPVSVNERPDRVWDWRQPQFLAGYYKASSSAPLLQESSEERAFVRQQYMNLLGREPDRQGWDFWTDAINKCNEPNRRPAGQSVDQCIEKQRRITSAAFFLSPEFQSLSSYIYRVYKSVLGETPRYTDFMADRALVAGSTPEQSKKDFAALFVQRPDFINRYQLIESRDQFIDELLARVHDFTGLNLMSERADFVNAYNSGATQTESRARVIRRIADSPATVDALYNETFIVLEYFVFLGRDPDAEGLAFWLNKVSAHNLRDVQIQQAMISSFITSAEYRKRSGNIVMPSNQERQQEGL